MSTFQAPGGTFGFPEQPPQRRGSNIAGIIGFSLSILSLVLCCLPYVGLLSIPALILSIIGLFHPKKGLAIAGTIIAAITAILALIWLFIIMAVPKAIGGLQLFDMVKSGAVVGQVTETAKANGGTLPADLSVTGLPPFFLNDNWGTPFIYTPRGDGTFTIESAGPDKTAGTSDDIDIGAALLQDQNPNPQFPQLRKVTDLPLTPLAPTNPADAPVPPETDAPAEDAPKAPSGGR